MKLKVTFIALQG